MPGVPERRAHSDAEIEAAVEALSDPARLEAAQRVVAAAAPALQRILEQALESAELVRLRPPRRGAQGRRRGGSRRRAWTPCSG